jgi:hypothetical protein
VTEAPVSACFKWRIGQAELTYTFRGVSDEEVLDRIREHLPLLHDILDACETRAAERAAARAAAQAQAQAPQAPTTPALTPEALQALHALLVAPPAASNGAAANGHALTAPPRCPAHGAMRESTKAPGTWFCAQKLADGSFCKSKA